MCLRGGNFERVLKPGGLGVGRKYVFEHRLFSSRKSLTTSFGPYSSVAFIQLIGDVYDFDIYATLCFCKLCELTIFPYNFPKQK